MRHLLTVASWEFSRGDEKRWILVQDRAAMVGWGFDSPAEHPWRTIQNPAGLMLGDAGGIRERQQQMAAVVDSVHPLAAGATTIVRRARGC
jgi:hypothetical protein